MAIVFARHCTMCGELLPLTSFYRHAASFCGRQTICKTCWAVKFPTQRNQRYIENDLYELDPEADLTW